MSWAQIISKNKNPIKNIKKCNKPLKTNIYDQLDSPYDNFNIQYGMDLHNLIFDYYITIENNNFLNKSAPHKIYSFFEKFICINNFIDDESSYSDSEESI